MRLSVLSVGYPLAPVAPETAGGAERILALLDAALVRAGHHSTVIAPEGSVTAGVLAATPSIPGPLDEAARRRAQQECRQAILRALDRRRFDVIHFHGLDFPAYQPEDGPPALATLHLPPAWYAPEVFAPERRPTRLVCVSETQRRSCPPGGALPECIPNGISLDEFRVHVSKRGFALALGRICPEKGFHLALDAAAAAGVPLLMAGGLFPYPEHERYFSDEILPRLDGRARRFLGPAGPARKRRLLAAARCLLVPSLVPETSSLVSMEALASGTPVIAFAAGALPEIVEHGRTGYLVRDAGEMAEAIRAAGRIDPQECRQSARRRFDARRMAAQYLELYGRLAGIQESLELSGRHV